MVNSLSWFEGNSCEIINAKTEDTHLGESKPLEELFHSATQSELVSNLDFLAT